MKVYFSGCHGAGKSTLAKYTSNKYNLQFISEVARMVLSERELQIDTLRYDIDLVNSYQQEVFNRQLLEESKYKDFVSDRSAIDTLAYAGQHSQILPNLMGSNELKTYLGGLRAPDSIIFFVRPTKATMKADGVREAISWDGAVAIDAKIKLLLEMFDIRYFQINTDSAQERVKFINSILDLV
jgi:predicted ATPase